MVVSEERTVVADEVTDYGVSKYLEQAVAKEKEGRKPLLNH